MGIIDTLKSFLGNLSGRDEIRRLHRENEKLAERERKAIAYIREKTNHLLTTMGTLPLRHEELDDRSLLEVDPIGIVCNSFEQILEHMKKVNAELKLAHDEIQGIFDCSDAAIFVLDTSRNIQASNSQARKIFAYDGNPVGKTCDEMICRMEHPDDCIFASIMASKRAERRSECGRVGRWFNVHGAPIKDRFGDITHVVLFYTDITEEKRVLDTLREREGMYDLILDNASDLFQSIAIDGSINYVNRAWRTTLGYTDEDLATLSIFDVIHPKSVDHCREIFFRLLAGARSGPVSFSFVTKHGRTVPVTGSVSCNFRDGKPYATCGIFHIMSGIGQDSAAPCPGTEDRADSQRAG